MKREEALAKFQEEEMAQIKAARTVFVEHLLNHLEPLQEAVMNGFEALLAAAKEQKKKDIVFFYASLLKIDVLKKQYTISLLAQDRGWYLDTESIEVTFSLDFLFSPLNELWDYLETKSKVYVGKVNRYDVRNRIFRELDHYNNAIADVLRILLKDLEQEPCFMEIPKAEVWELRWGEYRDNTQLLLRADRIPKTPKDWKKEWWKVKREADRLVFSCWYKGDFSHGDCTGFDLKYICFENCTLSQFTFDGADILSGKFIASTIKHCSFVDSNLQGVNFIGTTFDAVDFTDADVAQAVFSEKSLPGLQLTPEQLEVIFVEREG